MKINLKRVKDEILIKELVQRGRLSVHAAAIAMAGPKQQDYQVLADEWIKKNPKMFRFMETAAISMVRQGKKFGARLLSEQARWLCHQNSSNGGYKISNDIANYVVRRLVEKHPKMRPFIVFRILK